jgi:hypothetical protein
MLARSLRATLLAMLMVATPATALATCVVVSAGQDDMACCSHGFISEASTASNCCQLTSAVETQLSEARALPTLKSLLVAGPVEADRLAPLLPGRMTLAVYPPTDTSPPILQLSSALRI